MPAPKNPDHKPVFVAREVARLIRPWEHREGQHMRNFVGDIEDMLATPKAIKPDDAGYLTMLRNKAVKGDTVVLSKGQHWSFNALRRDYLTRLSRAA